MERITPEEKFAEAIRYMEEESEEIEDSPDEEEDEIELSFEAHTPKRREKNRRKNKGIIEGFIGSGPRTGVAVTMRSYYFALYAWATDIHILNEKWKTVRVLSFDSPSPLYSSIRTGEEARQEERILLDGQMLIQKDGIPLVVSIYRHQPFMEPTVYVEGSENHKKVVEAFAGAVREIATKENFFRGKNLEYSRGLRIIDAGDRTWESVILPDEVKADIRANTLGFLQGRDKWGRFGIPLKRGVLLAGDPGTGKTAICKAIMKEAADEITCIISNAYALDDEYYVSTLYEIARDLSPAIVFIEDIDMIGEDREEYRLNRSSLVSLLAELDGIEEQREIVTVATTNSLQALDKALSRRPSRFDRVINLEPPSREQRRELVRRLCRTLPFSESMQGYIARVSHGCTPAQVEEILRSLIIERAGDLPEESAECLDVSITDIDGAVKKINGRNRNGIGFTIGNGTNGKYLPL